MTTPVPLDVRPDDVNLIALIDDTGDSITIVLAGETRITRAGNTRITRGGNTRISRSNVTLNPITLYVKEDNLNLTAVKDG